MHLYPSLLTSFLQCETLADLGFLGLPLIFLDRNFISKGLSSHRNMFTVAAVCSFFTVYQNVNLLSVRVNFSNSDDTKSLVTCANDLLMFKCNM